MNTPHLELIESGTRRSTVSTDLPPGSVIEVPGRGDLFVRQLPGPPGAATLVLLHGWTATADLNWKRSYSILGQHFRVIAFDHRGHGRGIQSVDRFSLEDCADDVAAVAAALDIDRLIPVGYSMGGPIASLLWQRHRTLVDGLVMCATSRHFCDSPTRRAFFTLVNGSANIAGQGPLRALGKLQATALSIRLERRREAAGIIEQGLGHDWPQVLEAGRAIGRFDSRPWAGSIDVPTAIVATLDDTVVPTQRQLELAEAVPDATLHTVRGGHTACTKRAGGFTAQLVAACRSVASRVAEARPLFPSGIVAGSIAS